MGTTKRNMDLAIAIDPGFDSTKVVINGVYFKIPKEVVDVTENFEQIGEKKEGYVKTHYLGNRRFLVGEQARSLMQQPKMKESYENMQGMMDSFARFTTEEFEVNLITSIGLALIKYSNYLKKNKVSAGFSLMEGNSEEAVVHNMNEMKRYRIFIGMALPHDTVLKSSDSIKNKLARVHNFAVETAKEYYEFNFTIEKGRICSNSQVISALLGALSDDEGYPMDGMSILDNLPALIIDGGYKTVGISYLTTIQTVEDAESNQDYAMGNIHKRVAEKIRNEYGRTDISAFNIPGILEDKQTKGKLIYEKDDDTCELDVIALVEEERVRMVNEMIEYLNKKYNKLLDTRFVLVTGGTGMAYYDTLSEYVDEHKQHLKNKIVLTNYEFEGEELEPVYAIAVGMYKTLLHMIREYDMEKNKDASK